MNGNQIVCQLIDVEETKMNERGQKFYIVSVLYQKKVARLFVKDLSLFDKFKSIPLLQELIIFVDINLKNDGTFSLIPTKVEF